MVKHRFFRSALFFRLQTFFCRVSVFHNCVHLLLARTIFPFGLLLATVAHYYVYMLTF